MSIYVSSERLVADNNSAFLALKSHINLKHNFHQIYPSQILYFPSAVSATMISKEISTVIP